MSLSKLAALLLGTAGSVAAHGYVTSIDVDGTTYGGYLVDTYYYESDPPEIIAWSTTATDDGYVSPTAYEDSDIICHRGAEPGALSAEISAGGSVTLHWNTWPDDHHGPVITYLANCNGDCASVDKTTLEFFKIDAGGLIDDSTVPGTWATDQLISANYSRTLTIPTDIASGNYVLRHEIIALHGAETLDAAQNYPQCINLKVTGSGTATPSGTLGTALYKDTDPGIYVNIWQSISSYTIPGPALYTSGSTATGTSEATTTTTAAGTTSSTSAALTTEETTATDSTSSETTASATLAAGNTAVATTAADSAATGTLTQIPTASTSTQSSVDSSRLPGHSQPEETPFPGAPSGSFAPPPASGEPSRPNHTPGFGTPHGSSFPVPTGGPWEHHHHHGDSHGRHGKHVEPSRRPEHGHPEETPFPGEPSGTFVPPTAAADTSRLHGRDQPEETGSPVESSGTLTRPAGHGHPEETPFPGEPSGSFPAPTASIEAIRPSHTPGFGTGPAASSFHPVPTGGASDHHGEGWHRGHGKQHHKGSPSRSSGLLTDRKHARDLSV